MDNLKGYLMSLILVSVVASVVDMLSPNNGGIKKNLKLVVSLVALVLLLSPFTKFFSYIASADSAEEFIDFLGVESAEYDAYANNTKNYIISGSVEQIKLGIKQQLLLKFSIPSDECEIFISVIQTESGPIIDLVHAKLSGKSMWKDPVEIENYFSELLDCKFKVIS